MSLLIYFTAIIVISASVHCEDINNASNITTIEASSYSTSTEASETTTNERERVDVHVYYETLCRFSIYFFSDYLEPLILSMHKHIRLHLYPYGNAWTAKKDGKFVTTCQHGEEECYGNKLHACAIDILKNETKSALYAACMMARYSDDVAATQCGESMKINADPIKECAKSDKADGLLKYYADLSEPDNYIGVPHVAVNGQKIVRRKIQEIVCKALTHPPPACINSL